MNALEWTGECTYISGKADDVRQGKIGREFNHDRACFIRYCEMQRNSATKEGFHDSAQYIQHCLDDLIGDPDNSGWGPG